MEIIEKDGNIILTGTVCFDVGLSVDCGQSFRWQKRDDGKWHGIVKSTPVDIEQNENEIIFYNTSRKIFDEIWLNYFDLDRDYRSITDSFSLDGYLAEAVDTYYGIHILNQEPWEALCSFIISQNNNIPRIKGIISRLCESFGVKIGDSDYSFPSAEKISSLKIEELSVIRAGFRSKYILDAAIKVSSGEIDLAGIADLPIEQGRKELMKICGVGPKVAECALLYSMKKTEAFPVDVWVKRIMSELYPMGLPECTGQYRGIAQQYLFHWRRMLDE